MKPWVKVDLSMMFYPTELFPSGAGKSDVLITCYEWNTKVQEQRGIE